MSKQPRRIELLAPAKDYETLLDSLDSDKSREVQTKVVPRGARKGKAVKFAQ